MLNAQILVSEWQASSRVSEHQVEKQVIVLKARLEQVKRTIGCSGPLELDTW